MALREINETIRSSATGPSYCRFRLHRAGAQDEATEEERQPGRFSGTVNVLITSRPHVGRAVLTASRAENLSS
jgi:hypothetical protein